VSNWLAATVITRESSPPNINRTTRNIRCTSARCGSVLISAAGLRIKSQLLYQLSYAGTETEHSKA
jgi:hypothetical protein